MGFGPTVILVSQLLWKVEAPRPSRTICPVFVMMDGFDTAGALTDQATELAQVEQVLRELRPDEGVQQPSARDLRDDYRRYDFLG